MSSVEGKGERCSRLLHGDDPGREGLVGDKKGSDSSPVLPPYHELLNADYFSPQARGRGCRFLLS